MRGKEEWIINNINYVRITPAYAGKSIPPTQLRLQRQDHPRLCGEKLYEGGKSPYLVGSPPPMRGKVFLVPLISAAQRITPAYAGKSRFGGTAKNTG